MIRTSGGRANGMRFQNASSASAAAISGKREPSDKGDQAFLHRGIAARGFVRTFVLADGLEVDGAVTEHGLLHVALSRPEQAHAVRRIPITAR